LKQSVGDPSPAILNRRRVQVRQRILESEFRRHILACKWYPEDKLAKLLVVPTPLDFVDLLGLASLCPHVIHELELLRPRQELVAYTLLHLLAQLVSIDIF